MASFVTNYILLMIYSFLGWLCESLLVTAMQHKAVNSGFLNGPICPIYGFGAIFVILLLQPFQSHPVLVFILGVVLTSALEYFTSWIMEILFHTRWWDYSQFFLNLNGRICLLFSMMFGVMSLFVLYVLNPRIHGILMLISYPAQCFMAAALLAAFLIDLLSSLDELKAYDQDIRKFENAVRELKTKLNEVAPAFSQLELREQFNGFMELKDERINDVKQHLNARYEKLANQEGFHSRLKNAFPQMKISSQKLNTISSYLKERQK